MSDNSFISEIVSLGRAVTRLAQRDFRLSVANNLKPGFGYRVENIKLLQALVHKTECPFKDIKEEMTKNPEGTDFFVFIHGKGSGGWPKLVGVVLYEENDEDTSEIKTMRSEFEIETNWRSKAFTPNELGLKVDKTLAGPLPLNLETIPATPSNPRGPQGDM